MTPIDARRPAAWRAAVAGGLAALGLSGCATAPLDVARDHFRRGRLAEAETALLADAAIPLSLVALGMSLSGFGVRDGWRESFAISALKLVAQPLAVWAAARAMGLPALETQAITVLAAMPVGANVYLMSRQFDTLGGPVASSLVLSTAIAAVTVPVVLALTSPNGF